MPASGDEPLLATSLDPLLVDTPLARTGSEEFRSSDLNSTYSISVFDVSLGRKAIAPQAAESL